MRILDLSLFRVAVAFVALLACSLPSLAQLSTYNLTGASVDLGDNCFQLTPNATAQVGTVWANEVLDLEAPFHLQALMNFGSNDATGADGIVFVLQDVGPDAAGTSGGDLGFSGFQPSFGVEFDTWDNA